MACIIRELLDGPLILVHVVAKTDLRVDVVSEQVDVGLVLGASVERWELEQSLLDRSVVINMDCVLKHVVDEIRIWFDEVIKGAQNLQIFSLLLMEKVEAHLVLVQLHLVDGRLKLVPLVFDHLFSFFNFLFLLLKLFDLLIDLLLHHLK